MKKKIRYSIIVVASVLLVISTLYVPSGPATRKSETREVWFGYPVSYISQDFSKQDSTFSFFPRYFNFSLGDKDVPMVSFSLFKFLTSVFSVTLLLILIIALLEYLKGRASRVFSKVKV